LIGIGAAVTRRPLPHHRAYVVEDMLGAAERRFAVDDPVLAEQWRRKEEKASGEARRPPPIEKR
jgi:hypothetical protein